MTNGDLDLRQFHAAERHKAALNEMMMHVATQIYRDRLREERNETESTEVRLDRCRRLAAQSKNEALVLAEAFGMVQLAVKEQAEKGQDS